MPITATNPCKGCQFPGEVIILCVRWYLRYPLAYEHAAELLAERGVEVDPSCIWRWVQAYAPELNKRCRAHLKPTNKKLPHGRDRYKGQRRRPVSVSLRRLNGPDDRVPAYGQTGTAGAKRFFRKALNAPGNPVPRVINVDKNPTLFG